MLQIRHAFGLALALGCTAILWATEPAAPKPAVPKLDKPRIETYLRYAEGYVADVKMEIGDPKPSPFAGFYEVVVHLSAGKQTMDRHYYVTSDGQGLFSGTLWDLKKAPFADTQSRLPHDGFSFGPASAPVQIVLFSDFECPYCSELAKTMRDNLPAKYGEQVRVIFADFPLRAIHPWAQAASEGAHCLGEQKTAAFWAFHDWVFAHQKEVTAENLREKILAVAKTQDLEESKLSACLDSHTTAAAIEQTVKAGKDVQVQQTPTFFINGRMQAGALPWQNLDQLIAFELKRPKEFSEGADEKCCEITIPKVTGK